MACSFVFQNCASFHIQVTLILAQVQSIFIDSDGLLVFFFLKVFIAFRLDGNGLISDTLMKIIENTDKYF